MILTERGYAVKERGIINVKGKGTELQRRFFEDFRKG